MELSSIHAGSSSASKNNQNKKRDWKALKEIEASNKKYSLADLDRALEGKCNNDHQTTNHEVMNKSGSYRQHRRKNSNANKEKENENASSEVQSYRNSQNSLHVTQLSDSNTLQSAPDEEDILMEDMDDQNDIEMVSNYLTEQRSQISTISASKIGNEPGNDNFARYNTTTLEPTQLQTVYVVDTNFIISQLHTLEELRQLSEKYHHVLVIPTTAVLELDGLKSSSSEKIAKHARAGNNWIYRNLAVSNSGILGQKLRQKLDPNTSKDDSILDCCLYFKERLGCFVILLSNDKNLCLKALTEEVLTVSYNEDMTSELIASKSYEENRARFGPLSTNNNGGDFQHQLQPTTLGLENNIQHDNRVVQHTIPPMTFQEKATLIHSDILFVVLATIKSIMYDEYEEDLSYIGFEEEALKSLEACARCIYHFWIPVFSEYFKNSKFKREDWKSLPHCLTNVPDSQQNIDDMIFFWQDILEHLFIKKSEKDYNELVGFFQKWSQFRAGA